MNIEIWIALSKTSLSSQPVDIAENDTYLTWLSHYNLNEII